MVVVVVVTHHLLDLIAQHLVDMVLIVDNSTQVVSVAMDRVVT